MHFSVAETQNPLKAYIMIYKSDAKFVSGSDIFNVYGTLYSVKSLPLYALETDKNIRLIFLKILYQGEIILQSELHNKQIPT